MWFGKKRSPEKTVPFPGLAQSHTGKSALYATEQLSSDIIVVHSAAAGQDSLDNQRIHIAADLKALAAMTTGFALMGQRTTAVTDSLCGLREDLYSIAGRRLSCVIHLVCRTVPRQTTALHGSHDEYHDIAGAGLFQMFAANAQEVADFSLLAHRIAEQSLVPGVCAQDYYRTSHAMQQVLLPEQELVTRFIGASGDTIASPTPAQSLLFGEQRRRIPLLLDQDHPAGTGAVQDHESFFKAVAAQRPFFYEHLTAIVDAAFAEFAELTGRHYGPVTACRVDDAEYLIIAQGAVCEEVIAAVDLLRASGVRAGLIKINLLRPFPGAELTHLLKGRRAVTVLERTEQPLAEDLPLMREVRSALDKAQENGSIRGDTKPWPDYQSYRQSSDRPTMFSGVYGVGTVIPALHDLTAVYRNMTVGDNGSRRFFVGEIFTQPERRFPHLQTLQQQLNRDYPGLARLSVSAGTDPPPPARQFPSVGVHFLSSQGGLFAANLLAASLADALRCEVRTFPQGGLEQILQPTSVTLAWDREGGPITGRPVNTDALLIASYKLLENHALLATINRGGRLIVASNKPPEAVRSDLSQRIQQFIESHAIQVQVIDTEELLAASASKPAFVDQLNIWALLGAWLQTSCGLSDADRENVYEKLKHQLPHEHDIVDEILSTMRRAAAGSIEIPLEFWQPEGQIDRLEGEPPWTVKPYSHAQDHLFDVNRFWHSVGYLYDNGEAEHTLSDPWLATGVVPAASSAFRDFSPYRLKIPQWLPENCTGCGDCWAACPETALPPVALELAAIIAGAVTRLERRGRSFIQLKRVHDPLVKLAYKLLQKELLDQYLTLGPLLRDAFAQLVEQMSLADDTLERISAEFDPVLSELENFQIARTDRFFVEPHNRTKNSGMLLSLTLNPANCTSCGICVETCPEQAWQWVEQTTDQVENYRHNWLLQLDLPALSRDRIDTFVAAEDTHSHVNRLLDRNAYHSMVAGDGIKTGNGARTAIHLLTASAESIMQERFSAHTDRLEQLIGGLEDLIQGNISDTLSINDFNEFSRRLSRLERGPLDAAELARLVRDEGARQEIDPDGLQRLCALAVELKARLQQYSDTDAGKGRARLLFAVEPEASSFWSGAYPYNPYLQPWICHLPGGHAAGLAASMAEVIRRTLLEDIKLYRRTELEINGAYNPVLHDQELETLGWGDLSQIEQQLAPPVFLICKNHEHLQREIATLLSGRYPLRIVLIDQEGLLVSEPEGKTAYPRLSGDFDNLHRPQSAHLVIQASVGHPGHLIRSVAEMLAFDGPSLLNVYAPDPHASGFAIEKCIEQAALAVESRTFPLFRALQQAGQLTVSIEDNLAADDDWPETELILRAPDGQETTLEKKISVADWAINESRYHKHFKLLAKGHLNETMTPLADYLDLDTGQRESLQPYIDIANDKQQHFIAIVSAQMVDACELARNNWRRLQLLATTAQVSVKPVQPEQAIEPQGETMERPAEPDLSAYQQLTSRLLELCGYSQDPEFFNQSLGEFIRKDNLAAATGPQNEQVETNE